MCCLQLSSVYPEAGAHLSKPDLDESFQACKVPGKMVNKTKPATNKPIKEYTIILIN